MPVQHEATWAGHDDDYVQDYDEVMFPRCTGAWGSADAVYWYPRSASDEGLLGPYVKNTQVFLCPSAPNRRGYGYNMAFGYVSLGMIDSPAEKVIFSDDTFGSAVLYHPTQGVSQWGANFVDPPGSTGSAIVWGENCPHGRHNGVANVAFADGHAKAMNPITLWSDGTDTYYDP